MKLNDLERDLDELNSSLKNLREKNKKWSDIEMLGLFFVLVVFIRLFEKTDYIDKCLILVGIVSGFRLFSRERKIARLTEEQNQLMSKIKEVRNDDVQTKD